MNLHLILAEPQTCSSHFSTFNGNVFLLLPWRSFLPSFGDRGKQSCHFGGQGLIHQCAISILFPQCSRLQTFLEQSEWHKQHHSCPASQQSSCSVTISTTHAHLVDCLVVGCTTQDECNGTGTCVEHNPASCFHFSLPPFWLQQLQTDLNFRTQVQVF